MKTKTKKAAKPPRKRVLKLALKIDPKKIKPWTPDAKRMLRAITVTPKNIGGPISGVWKRWAPSGKEPAPKRDTNSINPWRRMSHSMTKKVATAASLTRRKPKIVPINNDPVSMAIRRVRVIKTLQGMTGRRLKNQYTAVYFVDHSGDWRWGMFCTNRNEVACSGEGYKRISGAQNGLRNLVKWLKTNDPVEIVKKDFRG